MIKKILKIVVLSGACIACAFGTSACGAASEGGKQGKMTEAEWKQAFVDSYGAESFTSVVSFDGEVDTLEFKIDTVNDVYSIFSEEEYYYFDDNFLDKDGYKYCILEQISSTPIDNNLFSFLNLYKSIKHYNNEEEYKNERNRILYKNVFGTSNEDVFGLVHIPFYYNASELVNGLLIASDNTVGKLVDLYKYFDYDVLTGIYSGDFKYEQIEFTISYTFADGKISSIDFVDEDNYSFHSEITEYNCTVVTLPPVVVEKINRIKELLLEGK